jgi:hypothetical protein
MDWTQEAQRLFQIPKPAHFTNYRHCCEWAEHDAVLTASDVNSIGLQQLGNPGWNPLYFARWLHSEPWSRTPSLDQVLQGP